MKICIIFWHACLIWFYRQFPLYNNDIRWQQPNPNPAGPYLAYPIISAQPPVSTEYTYYQLMPAPCAQVMGFYHPFPAPYSNTFQAANTVNTITTECTERPNHLGQVFPLSGHRNRNSNRGPVVPKVSDQIWLAFVFDISVVSVSNCYLYWLAFTTEVYFLKNN